MRTLFLILLLSITASAQVWSADVKIQSAQASPFQWQQQAAVRLLVTVTTSNDDDALDVRATILLPFQVEVLDSNGCFETYGITGRVTCMLHDLPNNEQREFSIVTSYQNPLFPDVPLQYLVFVSAENPDPDKSNNLQNVPFTKGD